MRRTSRTILILVCTALTSCSSQPQEQLIGVMIDNHEVAREYHRGLEKAPIVQEQLVEGFITRFIAFFNPDDLPESVGPVRSVRPYFVDGSSPLISSLFHVGGSPEALDRLRQKNAPHSYNALSSLDASFDYDDDAPAPHDRFLSKENITKLLAESPATTFVDPLFQYGSFKPEEPALTVTIDYYSPVHNVTYSYDPKMRSYEKKSGDEVRPPSPTNIVILETDVAVVGPFGRLSVTSEGKGAALLFRDGGMQRGTWSKTSSESFFAFTDGASEPLLFRRGQIWMIVLDSLDRVSWE